MAKHTLRFWTKNNPPASKGTDVIVPSRYEADVFIKDLLLRTPIGEGNKVSKIVLNDAKGRIIREVRPHA